MPCEVPPDLRAPLEALLNRAGIGLGNDVLYCLAGDGSDRIFVRLVAADGGRFLAVMPSRLNAKGQDEARAAYHLGRHFFAAGVAVPEIIAFDETSGLLLMEDLGDELLFHRLQRCPAETEHWYRAAIEALVALQIRGAPGFPQGHCWDTPVYDKPLMTGRESGYFYQALCRDLLGLPPISPELAAEFGALAERAAHEPAGFVLHRDFQSRNLMIHEERLRIIDFQGARLGPLGYDLAALLIDPYIGMPESLQAELFDHYCRVAARYLPFDRKAFAAGYHALKLQRNLQMLGAFAFLSQQRGKPFFAAFLQPAAAQLVRHLDEPGGQDFPQLRALARQVAAMLATKEKVTYAS